MKIIILLCILYQRILHSNAIYNSLASRKILPPKTAANETYFGFDITYVPDKRSMVISAPIADDIGRVYVCDTTNFNCTTVKYNIERDNKEYDHNYWLGATVSSGSSFFVACAPLFTSTNNLDIGATGQCYISNDNLSMESLILSKDSTKDLKLDDRISSYGWSLDVSEKDTISVGGPAMTSGRTLHYIKPDVFTGPKAMHGQDVKIDFNFGYSIASGNFASTSKLSYAVSSPYKYGEIVFFDEKWKVLKNKFKKPTVKVGEMFGATLCSARMFGRRSDLLVGAPARPHQKRYNVGAVYVFYAKTSMALNYMRYIVGYKEGSMFGSAIVNIGDLNGDKKDDIAIAAPFEDNKGVVYIYSGADVIDTKKMDKPVAFLQRITASSEYGFGLSLGVLKDYDQNGCNELAIGSPFNDTVTVVPCYAYIEVKLSINHPDLQNRAVSNDGYTNETYFLLNSCLDVKFQKKPLKAYAEFAVQVEILSDTSASITEPHAGGKYETRIEKPEKSSGKLSFCENIGINLPKGGRYDEPIKFRIIATEMNSPLDQPHFDPQHVLVGNTSTLTLPFNVWAAQCKNKETCSPNLNLTIVNLFPEPYLLGSSETENITLSLRNNGEVAYSACLKMEVTNAAIVQAPALSCTHGNLDHSITCNAPKPIYNNDTWDLGRISLKMTKATNKDKFISVQVSVFDNCNIPQNKTIVKDYALTRDFNDIEITGRSNLDSNFSMTVEELKTKPKHLEHIYTIRNKVANPWLGGPKFKVTVMKQQFLQLSKTPFKAQTENGHEISCEMTTTEDIFTAVCSANELTSDDKINVIIYDIMHLNPSKINELIARESFVLESTIELLPESLWDGPSNQVALTRRITTTILIKNTTVAIWIIVASCILGLLLLGIIYIIVAKKTYWLRRKNKERTTSLRKSIRRQTIRRSMMEYNKIEQEKPGTSENNEQHNPLCDEALPKIEESDEILKND